MHPVELLQSLMHPYFHFEKSCIMCEFTFRFCPFMNYLSPIIVEHKILQNKEVNINQRKLISD